ncbi:MAG: hypothetical protein WBA29_03765 [Xanthobacteraceae bacterium]
MADPAETHLSHPEEMRADFDLSIGKRINLKGAARVTPAGLICAGIAGVAVLIAATALVRAAR